MFYKDPDPAILFTGFQDDHLKESVLPPDFFCLLLNVVTFMSFFKDDNLLSTVPVVPNRRNHGFSSFCCLLTEGSKSVQIITDPLARCTV
jgi:hypothetical protein